MTYRSNSDWYGQAACKGLSLEYFFDAHQVTVGRRICAMCPVRVPCLQFSINTAVTDGIWGGLTPQERSKSQLPVTYVA